VSDDSGFTNGFNESKDTDTDGKGITDGQDYFYDDNGNMTKDQNKGITDITYNHLNLPTSIVFNNNLNTRIDYLYDATGKKVSKRVYYTKQVRITCGSGGSSSSKSASTNVNICYSYVPTVDISLYLQGGFQYKKNVLEFFPHAEGYVKRETTGAYTYVYNHNDHLGNVRVSYQDDGSGTAVILEENNYYPFGLKHEGYNYTTPTTNFYKYNNKELQTELGLNFYDYGARNYDPALGRWINTDPLAEKFYSESPYTYVNNDPLGYSDLDGKDYIIDIIRNKKGDITGINISGTLYIQGSGANQERANELNDFAKDNLKSKTINGISIGVSINYKYDKKKNEKNLKSGENILSFSNKPENDDNISHINALDTFNSAGKPVSLTGNTGVIFGNGSDKNTIFHESLHLLGLSDRYDDYRGDNTRLLEHQTTYPQENYEYNVMGNSRSTTLNKFQYEMWMKHALSRSKFHNNSNRVIGKMAVDRKGSFLMLPGDKTKLIKN
jgi:RHS repeat-associated protein